MKTICFFSGDISRSGGTEKVSTDIANVLANNDQYTIKFLSLCEAKEQPFFEISDNIKRDVLNDKWINPGPGYLPLISRLSNYIVNNNIDIIIDIDVVLDVLSVSARWLCRNKQPVKIISWEHFHLSYEWQTAYRRIIIQHFTMHSDHLVTLTEQDANAFSKLLKRKNRISCIYNPMPITDKQHNSCEARSKTILTVGNIIPVKGIDLLMDIASKVLPLHPDWVWKVVGTGPLLQDIVRFATANGLTNQIIMPGRINEIGIEYENASIYACTSKSEGLPMTLLEAKAHMLPIVSFDITSGPSEIISDGLNGYLITPFDTVAFAKKLSALMDNVDLRNKFQTCSSYDSEKFNLEHIIKKWNNLFEDLLK